MAAPALRLLASHDPQLSRIAGLGTRQRFVIGRRGRRKRNETEACRLRFWREARLLGQRSEFAAAVAALSNGAGNTQKSSTTTLDNPSTTLRVKGIGS